MNGAFGILATGIFANGVYGQGLNGVAYGVTGLFYGDKGQFIASLIGIVANIAWVAPVAALAFFVIGKVVGNRVDGRGRGQRPRHLRDGRPRLLGRSRPGHRHHAARLRRDGNGRDGRHRCGAVATVEDRGAPADPSPPAPLAFRD